MPCREEVFLQDWQKEAFKEQHRLEKLYCFSPGYGSRLNEVHPLLAVSWQRQVIREAGIYLPNKITLLLSIKHPIVNGRNLILLTRDRFSCAYGWRQGGREEQGELCD